jgi:hypothetical protein
MSPEATKLLKEMQAVIWHSAPPGLPRDELKALGLVSAQRRRSGGGYCSNRGWRWKLTTKGYEATP